MAATQPDGRSRRAHQKRESRRRAILESALAVFGERGYHATSISDIIQAAGIARGTFYLYFESKSAIFHDLLDELLAQLRESVVGVDTHAGAPPVEEQLVGTIERVLATVVQNRMLTNIIVREAVGLDAGVDRQLRDFYMELLGYIRESLVEGQKMGLVRELDTNVAATCILGSIKQFMELLVLRESTDPVDVHQMTLAVLDFNLRGVLAR